MDAKDPVYSRKIARRMRSTQNVSLREEDKVRAPRAIKISITNLALEPCLKVPKFSFHLNFHVA